MANTRLPLAVDVLPSNETAPMYSLPRIWAWLDGLPKAARPALLRGDVALATNRCSARPRIEISRISPSCASRTR